jgi:hypothetical protein
MRGFDVWEKPGGVTLEFLGPSGVGKTKLLGDLLQMSNISWKGQPSFIFTEINKNKYYDTPHSELLEKKTLYISAQKLNSVQKIRLIKYFSETLLRDLYIRFEDTNSNYCLDEGVLCNFPNESLMLSDKDFSYLIKNKSFIYLRPDDCNFVADRILKRANEGGHIVASHQGLNYKELVDVSEKGVISLDNVTQRIEVCGGRVLRLCVDSNQSGNQKAALEFMENSR